MSTLILGALGLATLLVLVGAFLAAKVWHWAHVLTLVLLYASTVAYLVLMAQSAKIRWDNQKREQQAKTNYERQIVENDALAGGTKDRGVISRLTGKETLIRDNATSIGGIRLLQHQVTMLNRDRGRVWRNAVLLSEVDQQTGKVTIGFPVTEATPSEEGDEADPASEEPAALGLQPDAVVYVFEQGPASTQDPSAGRQYLGEFRVTAVDGRQAMIEPLDQLLLDVYGGQRLLASQGPWTVYESMPADDPAVFAGLDEQQLRALLPAESVEEYLRDGGEATDDDDEYRVEWLDDEDNVVGPEDDPSDRVRRRYRRQPRDYAYEFKDLSEEQAELVALIQATEADLAKLDAALASAKRLQAFREDEIEMLEHDLELVRRDRERIEAHVATLEQQAEKAEGLLLAILKRNASLAERLAQRQGSMTPAGRGALDVDGL